MVTIAFCIKNYHIYHLSFSFVNHSFDLGSIVIRECNYKPVPLFFNQNIIMLWVL